jgi:hypothetical protein
VFERKTLGLLVVVSLFAIGFFWVSQNPSITGFAISQYIPSGDVEILLSSEGDFGSFTEEFAIGETVFAGILTSAPQENVFLEVIGPSYAGSFNATPVDETHSLFSFTPDEVGEWEIRATNQNITFSKDFSVRERTVTVERSVFFSEIVANDYARITESLLILNDFGDMGYELGIDGYNFSVYDKNMNLLYNSRFVDLEHGWNEFIVTYYQDPPTYEVINKTDYLEFLVTNEENQEFTIVTQKICEEPKLYNASFGELTDEQGRGFSWTNNSIMWKVFPGEEEFILSCFQFPREEVAEENGASQGQAVVGLPVRWKRVVSFNLSVSNATIDIPEGATNISIWKDVGGKQFEIPKALVRVLNRTIVLSEEVQDVELEYDTEAPQKIERELSALSKSITVSSDIHYKDVVSYTDIPEVTDNKDSIKLYWIVDGERVEHEFQAFDTDNDGLLDRIEWVIPHLSNQTFEVSITILNLQSYPTVGGNWTVMFETNGTADLRIYPVNGTTWDNVRETEDLKFLEVRCDNESLDYQWSNGSVVIYNYSCDGVGYEISKVLTGGDHYLEFDFGGQKAYAKNYALGGNVQRHIVTGTASHITDTISISNVSQAFIVFTANTNDATPDDWQFTPNISSTTQVTFDRYDGGGLSSSISWEVVESQNFNVQRGMEALLSGTADRNVTISAVNLSSTFVIVYGRCADETAGDNHAGFFSAKLTNSTNLWLRRGNAGKCDSNVSWQVVNWEGAIVQYGESTIPSGQPDTTALITGVNLSRTMLVFGTASIGTDNGMDTNLICGNITDSTHLNFTKLPGSTTANSERLINWYVVEVPGAVVQTGYVPLSSDTNIAVNSVNMSMTFEISSGWNTGGGNTFSNSFYTINLTNSTLISFDKQTTAQTQNIVWYMMEIPKSNVPIIFTNPQVSPSSPTNYNTGPYQFNITISTKGLDVVYIESNFSGTLENTTVTTHNGDEYYTTFQNLSAGYYSYRWFANNTYKFSNFSDVYYYQINKISPTIHLALNGTEGDREYTYPNHANATGWVSVGDSSATKALYLNGTQVSSGTPATYVILLGAGYYNFTYTYGESENYTSSMVTRFATVNQGTPPLSVSFDPSNTISYPGQATVSGNGCPLELACNLYRNNTSTSNPETLSLAVGYYNYTFNTTGNANYTSYSVSDQLLIGKGATKTYLYINGTRTDREFELGNPANFTVYTNVSGKYVELWTNYSDGGWKLWDSGNEILENITSIDYSGKFVFEGNFSGDENYTSSSESWIVTGTSNPPPQWSDKKESPYPAVYSPGADYQFNVTWTDNEGVDEVVFEFLGTNYSYKGGQILNVSNEFSINFQDLAAGNYLYRWYANDTTNKWNSELFSYNVSRSNHTIHLAINSSESNVTYYYPMATNATGWLEVSQGGGNLYVNQTGVANPHVFLFGGGYWNYTFYYSQTQNYTSQSITRFLTINKGPLEVYLYVNGSRSNQVMFKGDAINFTVYTNVSSRDVSIWTNYSDGSWKEWASGSEVLENITTLDVVGVWNFTANFSGDQNYTEGIESFVVDVDEGPVFNSISYPPLQGYDQSVTIEANITDNHYVDSAYINITYPNTTEFSFQMQDVGDNVWQYNFSDAWQGGQYSFEVTATDSNGYANTTNPYNFEIQANATISYNTTQDIYGPNNYVYLMDLAEDPAQNRTVFSDDGESWVPGTCGGTPQVWDICNSTDGDGSGGIVERDTDPYSGSYSVVGRDFDPVAAENNLQKQVNLSDCNKIYVQFYWFGARLDAAGPDFGRLSVYDGSWHRIFEVNESNQQVSGNGDNTPLPEDYDFFVEEISGYYDFSGLVNFSWSFQMAGSGEVVDFDEFEIICENTTVPPYNPTVNNTGSTNFSFYALMQIRNDTDNSLISTQINDTTPRTVLFNSTYNLSVAWNTNPWSTATASQGYYKLYTELRDITQNVLVGEDGEYMNYSYTFYVDSSPPEYNNFGSNATNPDPNDYVKFYANWSDNGALDTWEFYWNASGNWEKVGTGKFSSNPSWSNTTQQIPPSAEGLLVKYAFFANDTQGAAAWTSNETLLVRDVTSPNVVSTNVEPLFLNRNETVNITAEITDNFGVNSSWAFVRNGGEENRSMDYMGGDIYNLTYKCTEIGDYNVTVYANDSYNNLNNGTIFSWQVFGWSNVTYLLPIQGDYPVRSLVSITCMVSDTNLSIPIESYPVYFYANDTFLGTNYTNQTGHADFYWDTTGLDEGYYSVRCIIEDNDTLFYNASLIEGNETIYITVPNIVLTGLEQENSGEEYEFLDTISWINTTLNNTGGSSGLEVNSSLFVADPFDVKAAWGPDETLLCDSELMPSETCEVQFNNNTNGYVIPLTASTGIHHWNVTANWTGGGTPPTYNNSYTFVVFDLRQNMTSSINPSNINQNESSIYNFTFSNPFSSSLTNVNITINCPEISINCTCVGSSNGYCELGTISPGSNKTASFNITTNSSSQPGYANINATVYYTNPGNEDKSWAEEQNKLLYIKGPTKLNVTITQYPSTATRGSAYELRGNVNDTGSLTNNIWLNWSLPFGLKNQTGELYVFNSTLGQNEILWNNITALFNSSTKLGPNNIELKSASDEESEDISLVVIDVYSNTSIYPDVDDKNKLRNQGVTFYARLVYDNGTGVYNELINFNDITDDYDFGNAYTNSTGWATLGTTIPSSATLADHTINVSYSGNPSIYILASSNTSLTVTINDAIKFENILANPLVQGYGQNVSLTVHVDSLVTLDRIFANITYPNGSSLMHEMEDLGADNYRYVLEDTWQMGQHDFNMWANNTQGFSNYSSKVSFDAYSNVSFVLATQKGYYNNDEDVLIFSQNWGNGSFMNRMPLNISPTADETNVQINMSIDTQSIISSGKMKSDCSDMRFYYNNVELPYWLQKGCNTTDTQVWVKVPSISSLSNTTVYFYYNNPSASSESNYTQTMELIGEAGEVVANGSWENYSFSTTFVDKPVVFADISSEDPTQADRRIDNVTKSGFQLKVEDYFLGDHNNESAYFLALRKGEWIIGGYLFVVFNDSVSSTSENVPIGYTFPDNPIFISDIQTVNEVDPAHTRHGGSRSNTYIATDIEENESTAHVDEDVGFAAIEAVSGTCDTNLTNGMKCELGNVMSNGVSWVTIYSSAGFQSKPSMTMTMMTTNGGNNADLRFNNEDTTSWQFRVEETPAYDDSGHNNENNSYVAFDQGLIYGTKYLASEPLIYIGEEEDVNSIVSNTGSTNTSFYLLMQVQRNESGTWNVLQTNVNESFPRTVETGSSLSLSDVWNSVPWNTDNQPDGTYMVYVGMMDGKQGILTNQDGTFMNYSYQFDVGNLPYSPYSGTNESNPTINTTVQFYSLWFDDSGLSSWIFSWTGGDCETWKNDTVQTFSSSNNSWANLTKDISEACGGKTIYWKVYANDTSDNWNYTSGSVDAVSEYISIILDNIPVCFGSQYAGQEVQASDGSIPACGSGVYGFPLNITIDSSVFTNIWIKASGNLSDGKGHEIDLKNLRFNESSSPLVKTNMSLNYTLFESDIAPGTDILRNIYWWLFIPPSQPAGGPYTTNIDIMVNKST